MKKIIITTDCVCDLPEELLEQYDVKVIHFYIVTEHGWFKDMDEITSGNIVEYFERGGSQVQTKAPFPEEYLAFFENVLKEGDEVIHLSVSPKLSLSWKNALMAAEKLDGRVHVVDSAQLSTGIAHLVIKATELVRQGKEAEEIIEAINTMKHKVSSGFIAENANYLYRTGHVKRWVKNVCEVFRIHPVLKMKNGVMGLKTIKVGDYDKAVIRYVRGEMRRTSCIEKERLFITHADCGLKLLTKVKKEVTGYGIFREIHITEASATISSNCGANTIGVLFVKK